jgi:DNA-binding MarR family transcriptional regulator
LKRFNGFFALFGDRVRDPNEVETRMSMLSRIETDNPPDYMTQYLDSLALVERLHRLLLDVVKDEFERVGVIEINAVQALLLFNIGEQEVTAGELKTRGYYQGSNVSYNLKKLVDLGYMHHQRCSVDRRSVRVRLTGRGREIRKVVADLFQRHAEGLQRRGVLGMDGLGQINASLRRMERYWTDQIRYIY